MEITDVLSFLGAENAKDLDELKTSFNAKFIPMSEAHKYPDVASKVIGKRMGEITSKLVDFGKAFDIDVTFDSLKERKVEESIEDFKSQIGAKMTELKDASKSGNDKKVNDLLKELEDSKKSIGSYKEANEKLMGEYDSFKSASATNIRSYKINHQLESLKSKISWIDDISDVQRIGFDAAIKNKFQWDLDEKDNLIIKDSEGKLIPKADKAGAFAEPLEILDSIAMQNKLKKMNNVNNKNINFVPGAERKSEGYGIDKIASSSYQKRLQQLKK